jgi:hypothetical protein
VAVELAANVIVERVACVPESEAVLVAEVADDLVNDGGDLVGVENTPSGGGGGVRSGGGDGASGGGGSVGRCNCDGGLKGVGVDARGSRGGSGRRDTPDLERGALLALALLLLDAARAGVGAGRRI